jgi:hypothetical protein
MKDSSSPSKWALALSVVKDDDEIVSLYFGTPEVSSFSSIVKQCTHNFEAAINFSNQDITSTLFHVGLTLDDLVFLESSNRVIDSTVSLEPILNCKMSQNSQPHKETKKEKQIEKKVENKVLKDLKQNASSSKEMVRRRASAPRARSQGALAKTVQNYAKDQVTVSTAGMSEFEAVAYSIAIPHEVKPKRMSNMFTSEPTAIANPWEVVDATFPNTVFANSSILPQTETFRFLFRDPLRSCITPISPTAVDAMSIYQIACRTTGGDISANWWLTAAEIQTLGKQNFLPGTTATTVSSVVGPYVNSYSVHGSTLYQGKSSFAPGSYYPMTRNPDLENPTGWLIQPVSVIASGTAYTVQIIPYRKSGQDVQFFADMTSTTTTAVPMLIPYGVTAGGSDGQNFDYFTISIVQKSGPIVDFICNVFLVQTGIAFGQTPIPGMTTNVAAAETIRISSVGALLSNKAAPINRQGKVTSVQIPASISLRSFLNSASVFDSIAKLQSSLTKPADKGRYSFLKPTQPSDFDYFELNLVRTSTGAVRPLAGWNLENNHDYLVIAANITTVAGQDLLWDYCYGVEYRTTDTWRDQAEPTSSPEAYNQALVFLKKLPQHYENPLHIGAILSMVRKAANKGASMVMQYGPAVLRAAEKIEGFTR